MQANDRLVQRELDGALPRAEAAAVERMIAGDAQLNRGAESLRGLDADLKRMAAVERTADRAEFQARIVAALPEGAPARQVRVRPIDLVYATSAVVLVALTYGLLGAAVHTLLEQAVVLVWIVAIGLIGGMAMLLAPGLLRALESNTVGRLFGRPVAIGSADVLVYRAAGAALVVGAVWLAY